VTADAADELGINPTPGFAIVLYLDQTLAGKTA
jgi:hypothetical protein